MKISILISFLLFTVLAAQNHETIHPTHKEVAQTVVFYGMTSIGLDYLSPTYDSFESQVAKTLVKLAVVIIAKEYGEKENPKKFYTRLLQIALVSLVVYDIQVRDYLR